MQTKSYVWLGLIVFILLSMYGYVQNIISLADSIVLTGLVVLRAIGVLVVPLGAILGYF